MSRAECVSPEKSNSEKYIKEARLTRFFCDHFSFLNNISEGDEKLK